MKALLIGDVHLADRPPSVRRDTYAEDILDKLRWCVQEAVRREADVIIQDGDLFHVKAPVRTSHGLVQRVHEVIMSSHIPWIIVPGNHDMQHDRLDSLSSQPLGALCRMENVSLLLGPHDFLPIFGLPYLADWQDGLPKWLTLWRKFADTVRLERDDWPLLVTHAPIFPPGIEPPYDYIAADEWAELMEKGTCLYGHIHDYHGIYQPLTNTPVTMINVGSISRGSLHENTLARAPKVVWYDAGKTEILDVPHKPASEVFMLEDHQRVTEETKRMTDFLEGVESQEFTSISSVEEVRSHVLTLGLNPATVKVIDDLVEWASNEA